VNATSPEDRIAGVLATVSGALLVVSLFISWWGLPDTLTNPPPNLPDEIAFMAGAAAEGDASSLSALELYSGRDLLWLAAGTGAFAFGIVLLLQLEVARLVRIAIGVVALVSLVLIVLELASPPDLLQLSVERGAEPLDIDFELPFTRELGIWIAAVGAAGSSVAAAVSLRSPSAIL
jgi:hypothetical protein